ncbi:transporter substrate-binding domain-containing protein [uncultured Aquitalea sp.]|uniref:substrate-binding periplasmic protein n=1 Tax=uncultured Aquitalea sp. TaxID=540272 RepID=UPI0025E45D4A|nr:transporter substrate-binding domain-containing protein [uncultured Aquitalea sp.]
MRTAFLFACLYALAAIANGEPLTLRTSGQEANPVKFDPANKRLPGFSVELMQAMRRADPELGFQGQDQLRPLRRIEADLENGKLDVFIGLVKSPARLSRFAVIQEPPLYIQYTQLAVRKEDPIEVLGFDDVRRLGDKGVIAVPQGSAYAEFLRARGGLRIDDGAISISASLKKLLLGRVRFIYYSGVVLEKYLREEGLNDRVRLLPTLLSAEEVCVMVSKNAQAGTLERVRIALKRLQRDGTLAKLRLKYGVSG